MHACGRDLRQVPTATRPRASRRRKPRLQMPSALAACCAVCAAVLSGTHHSDAAHRRQPLNALHDSSLSGPRAQAQQVQLLVLIFTQRGNKQRRKWQRATWLRHHWSIGEDNGSKGSRSTIMNWRYVYVLSRDVDSDPATLDKVQGDMVTLSAVQER